MGDPCCTNRKARMETGDDDTTSRESALWVDGTPSLNRRITEVWEDDVEEDQLMALQRLTNRLTENKAKGGKGWTSWRHYLLVNEPWALPASK